MNKNYGAMWFFVLIVFSFAAFAGKRITVPTDHKSIQRAIIEAERGDTVFVLKGTYRENVVMSNGIVLMGEDPDKTVIRGNHREPVVKAANHAVLKNFTIKQGGIGILSIMILIVNESKKSAPTGI